MTTLRLPLPLAAFHVLSDRVCEDAFAEGQHSADVTVAWLRREGHRVTENTDAVALFESCKDRPTPIPAYLLSAEAALDYTGLADEQAHQFREGFLRGILSAILEYGRV